MVLAEERERARSLATRIVSFSIGLIGVALLVAAVALPIIGGAELLLLSVVLFLAGAAMAGLGFFFQLVPLRVEELAGMKRDYDARVREKR